MATPQKKKVPELLAGERLSNESDRAVIACNEYLRMGIGRSFRLLAQNSIEMKRSVSISTLAAWSTEFGWQSRASEYDAVQDEMRTQARNQAMLDGLALDYERVNKLKRLAEFLEDQLYEQGEEGRFHNVWTPDVKQIGSGADAERVDIERFNQGILAEYRAVLDDLAKETGGRVRKNEISGVNGKPIEIKSVKELTDDELERIARGE